MNGKALLDTNAVIAVFARDKSALSLVTKAAECFVPSIVAGELFYGAFRSQNAKTNIDRLHSFFNSATILPCDDHTAVHYGRIKKQLREEGSPIPEKDIWIAAIASQHQLPLVSQDVHFDQVEDLTRLSW